MASRIEQYYIEFYLSPEGEIQETISGNFLADAFQKGDSIFKLCPFLEGSLDSLSEGEAILLEGMQLFLDEDTYYADVELFQAKDALVVLIHNRTKGYKYLEQVNQSRNEQVFLKRELKKQNEELERLRKEAEIANEQKSRFLAMMSHEARNPLNVILAYTELIAKEEISDRVAEFLKYLAVSGRNLKVIVEDILDLSRVEAGKLELSNEPISLATIMDQMANNYRSSHRDIDIKLDFSCSNAIPPFILGDDVRLYQVLTNLVNNSIKFTPSGSVSTTIDVLSQISDQLILKFEVRDTGRGMTKQQAADVFEEYKQNSLDDNRIHKGAGLGLAIVKRLVTAMEGEIKVESEVGRGTVFSLEIPFTIAPQSQPEKQIEEQAEIESIEGKRILAADDNFMNREIVAHILKREKANFTLVKDGIEALTAMQEETFDLVLLDINMPNLSGDALIKQKEAYEQSNAHTPILALTGNSSKEDIRGFHAIGFSDVIPKPFTSDQFVEAIIRNLKA